MYIRIPYIIKFRLFLMELLSAYTIRRVHWKTPYWLAFIWITWVCPVPCFSASVQTQTWITNTCHCHSSKLGFRHQLKWKWFKLKVKVFPFILPSLLNKLCLARSGSWEQLRRLGAAGCWELDENYVSKVLLWKESEKERKTKRLFSWTFW